MNKVAKKKETAIGLAYKSVMELGYSHSELLKADCTVNYPTLRNIRDGKPMRRSTEHYYLKLFVGLINKEYLRRVENGGDGAAYVLRMMKEILLAEVEEWLNKNAISGRW